MQISIKHDGQSWKGSLDEYLKTYDFHFPPEYIDEIRSALKESGKFQLEHSGIIIEVDYESLSKKYNDKALNECPICSSDFICSDKVDSDERDLWRNCECESCGFQFQEIFTFNCIGPTS